MIAHSTALESITMDVDHNPSAGSANANVGATAATAASVPVPPSHNAAATSGAGGAHWEPSAHHAQHRSGASAMVGRDFDHQITDNVWGGIPAKNHRGENLLLFIGMIDILQSYGMFKKVNILSVP